MISCLNSEPSRRRTGWSFHGRARPHGSKTISIYDNHFSFCTSKKACLALTSSPDGPLFSFEFEALRYQSSGQIAAEWVSKGQQTKHLEAIKINLEDLCQLATKHSCKINYLKNIKNRPKHNFELLKFTCMAWLMRVGLGINLIYKEYSLLIIDCMFHDNPTTNKIIPAWSLNHSLEIIVSSYKNF